MAKRIEWVDIVKGFGILFVMLGHSMLSKADAVWMYSFHLGLFFFCTGYTFHPERYATLGALCKSRMKSILLPYAVYSLIWLVFETTVSTVHDHAFSMGLFIHRTAGIFLQMRGTDYHGNCWFLPAIFLMDLLFFLVLKATKEKAMLRHLISAAAMIAGFSYVSFAAPSFPLPWHPDIVLMVMIIVDFGYTVREKAIPLNLLPVIAAAVVLSIGLTVLEYRSGFRFDMYENSVGNIFCYLIGNAAGIIMIAALSMKIGKNAFLSYIGRNSLIFYALHKVFYRIEKPVLSAKFAQRTGLDSDHLLHQYAVSLVMVLSALAGIFILNEIKLRLRQKRTNRQAN